jgi:cold shock CspA family protein
MKGKIISWKDDKGYGFISASDQNEKIFFHISSVKKATRKPELGDTVIFEADRDLQGRLKATYVLLEGVPLANTSTLKKIVTEPMKKDGLDYLIYVILALLLAGSLGLFIKTGAIESALLPGVIFSILLFFLLNRKKQPANKSFSCSKCRSIASHDDRTVSAWNRGFDRLYCKPCHQKWLSDKPKEYVEEQISYSSSKSGCLGLFVVFSCVPIICIVGTIKWMV